MKITLTVLMNLSLLALCVSASNSELPFGKIMMPEVIISPFKPQRDNKITNLVHKGNFALRAKNLTTKEFLETLFFLSDQSCFLSNDVLTVRECTSKEPMVDSIYKIDIIKLAKEIIIPEVTLRPPATIVDAMDFLYQASADYDDPEKPKHKCGINFAVKSPDMIKGFGQENKKYQVPQTSSHGGFETMLCAIKHICEETNCRFIVYGKTIIFLPEK